MEELTPLVELLCAFSLGPLSLPYRLASSLQSPWSALAVARVKLCWLCGQSVAGFGVPGSELTLLPLLVGIFIVTYRNEVLGRKTMMIEDVMVWSSANTGISMMLVEN